MEEEQKQEQEECWKPGVAVGAVGAGGSIGAGAAERQEAQEAHAACRSMNRVWFGV